MYNVASNPVEPVSFQRRDRSVVETGRPSEESRLLLFRSALVKEKVSDPRLWSQKAIMILWFYEVWVLLVAMRLWDWWLKLRRWIESHKLSTRRNQILTDLRKMVHFFHCPLRYRER